MANNPPFAILNHATADSGIPRESPNRRVGISGTIIRFVEGECRQACTLACEDNERILSTYAINPGGSFVFDADNKATFRPQRQGVSVKVVLACAPKG
jgi:hypothetical protein